MTKPSLKFFTSIQHGTNIYLQFSCPPQHAVYYSDKTCLSLPLSNLQSPRPVLFLSYRPHTTYPVIAVTYWSNFIPASYLTQRTKPLQGTSNQSEEHTSQKHDINRNVITFKPQRLHLLTESKLLPSVCIQLFAGFCLGGIVHF